jgi:3-methyladenine DNA glycosylase AlkD
MIVGDAVQLVQEGLSAAGDPVKAQPMADYMKTDMPFYGVQKAGRTPIVRRLARECPPSGWIAYEATVLALWELPHREEKYIAIAYARSFDAFVDARSLDLFRYLIVDGAWWDFVDEVAIKLVGRSLLKDRQATQPRVRAWESDEDMWLRRTSIICQIGHKAETDSDQLAEACTSNLEDTEFFIRKAIGWGLREYAKTDPDWVRAYVGAHRDEMSGLSYREAMKHLL